MIEVEDINDIRLSTKEAWDKEFRRQLDYTKGMIERKGSTSPHTWILLQKNPMTGETFDYPQNFIAVTEFDGRESKDRYFTLMRAIAYLGDAIASVFCTEAWGAPSAGVAPSQHPDRHEMVILMGTHRAFGDAGAVALIHTAGIPDDDTSPRTVDEWRTYDPSAHSYQSGVGKVVFTDEELATMDLDDTFEQACRTYVEMNQQNLQFIDRSDRIETPKATV